jgi:hypothetical protein
MTQFVKTIKCDIFNLTASALHGGQWVQDNATGSRGQFLGVTARGTVIVRWQRDGNFARRDAKANKPLRDYAKIYGAK